MVYFNSQNSSLNPGRKVRAKFTVENSSDVISEAIDYFGKNNISIRDSVFIVDTIDSSMIEFAKLYAKEVEVIEPQYIRDELIEIFREVYEKMTR